MATSLFGKCDWSKVYLAYGNSCNVYKFEVAGTVDTCNKHDIKIIKKGATTVAYSTTYRGFGYTFGDTGQYYIRVNVKNACCGGDTTFYVPIHVTCKPTTKPKCDWSKVKPGFSYSGRSYKFEISSYDTCLTYTNIRYGKGKADTLNHDRVFGITFSDTGIWYVISLVHNKCTGCDTGFYLRLHVIDSLTTSTETIVKHEPKIVAIYDLYGRRVYNIRENEILIFVYSDGTKIKRLIKK